MSDQIITKVKNKMLTNTYEKLEYLDHLLEDKINLPLPFKTNNQIENV